MASTTTLSASFEATPDELVAVLTDPEFLVAQQLLDVGTVRARVEERSRDDGSLVLGLHATEYARGLLGIDRSRTEYSVTTYRWDLRSRRCRWDYRRARGDRFEAGGIDRVEPADEGARLTTEFRIDVQVPLLGKQVERLVMRAFRAREPKYVALIRQHCERLVTGDR